MRAHSSVSRVLAMSFRSMRLCLRREAYLRASVAMRSAS